MSDSPNGSSVVASPPAEDEAVHYNGAAKALGVSRKTVERMVKRGELERDTRHDTTAGAATVTKRSLVAALERRRGEAVDLSRLSRDVSQSSPPDVGRELRELVEPLVEQVVEARTRAAEAESKVRLLEERAQSTRERDELIASLVAGSWRERRRARRDALAKLAQGS